VADLAALALTGGPIRAEQGLVTGAVPLTPIQRRFFATQDVELHHFNQSLLFEVRSALPPALLGRALDVLVRHHDALRLRFVQKDGAWSQSVAGLPDPATATWIDLSALPFELRRGTLEEAAAQLQTSFDLGKGPLVRSAFFDFGAEPGRLLLTVHHLAIDGVSWRILLEDLHAVWSQLAAGAPATLPPKTTSFRRWAERLIGHAQSGAFDAELAHWRRVTSAELPSLPVDRWDGGSTAAIAAACSAALDEAETQALLHEVPAVYRTEINDILLTGLAQLFAGWTGERRLRVDLEGHGREELFEDTDLSRTVGWFTAVYPVLLDLGAPADPGTELLSIKEQLRSIPSRGIGYGLSRYGLGGETAAALECAPEIGFNYLGQLDQALPASSPFRPARESGGPVASPRRRREHALEVIASVSGGRLQVVWSYSAGSYDRATVEGLAAGYVEALRSLIAHCQSPEAGGFTVSDFPLVQINAEDLDDVLLEVDFEERSG
jgi:non-ribosomal peptide synthase protein (TIGR01720 family)